MADTDLIKEAKENYKIAEEGWKDIYRDGLDDMRFTFDVDGGQWPDDIKNDRKGRPMLTTNKLLKFQRQMRGEARLNRPRVKVIPVDDKADVETASLFDGIIRMIEYQSDAEVAYDTAYSNALAGSIGFMRLATDYEDELSFDQKIMIKRVPNPYSVKIDPGYQEFDASDIKWGFIEENYSKKEFEAAFKGAKFGSFEDNSTDGTQHEGWFNENNARVAEYFYKEERPAKIGLVEVSLPEGLVHTGIMELDEKSLSSIQGKYKVLKERETKIPVVKWVKMSGYEVLDKGDWPGKYIPIILMMGDEIVVNGKRYILSLIRGAKDPQRMYNYWTSAATETMALAPKNQFIVTAKQIEGYEGEWEEANRKNRMYLRYKPDGKSPPPHREPQIQIPAGFIAMMQNTSFELEDSLGKYETTKGAPSSERSAKAINAKIAQSDKGTFTFIDNQTRAITFLGKQLIDLIPKIYDTKRALSIMGEDGTQSITNINVPTSQIGQDMKPIKKNDLSVGRYDLIATVGASYGSRRQEAAQDMKETMQYAPTLAPIIAPLFFKYSDFPGAQEIYTEIKKAIAQNPALSGQQPQGG